MPKFIMLLLTAMFLFPAAVHAAPPITAYSAILIDQNSGKVLYSYNAHERRYPAGLTTMLTALAALEHLEPDNIVTVGAEINQLPAGVARAGHQIGEYITIRNLLRGMIIRNGNDSANVLALETVRVQRQQTSVPFAPAMGIFGGFMNELAAELGAANSNFVNQTGLHNDAHSTTAYDLALIARAFMAHPVLREIAAEAEVAIEESAAHYGMRDYHWTNLNELVGVGAFSYRYATGIRAGTTPQASDSLAASASRGGVDLIAIILASADPGRWQDARALFEYGFETYAYHILHETGELLETVQIENARLGQDNLLEVAAAEEFRILASTDEFARITRQIVFYDEFLANVEVEEEINTAAPEAPDEPPILLSAPMEEGEIIGMVYYTLDGEILFEGELLASREVLARSLDSDMDYYIAFVQENVFSMRALPFWLGFAGVLVGIAGVMLWLSERRKRKNAWYGSGNKYNF